MELNWSLTCEAFVSRLERYESDLLYFIEVLNKLSAEKIREEGGCEIKELPCLS